MRNRVRARDGRHLMVERLGDPRGRPVFLLHGMPGSRLGPAPRGMVLYQRKTQLITYDRPGYGGSERLAGRCVADVVEDVRAIADSLGLERFAVVGRSGGAPHALACAALMPERVTRTAALVGLAPWGADGLDWFEGMAASNVLAYSTAAADPDGLAESFISRSAVIRQNPVRLIDDLRRELTDSDRVIVNDAGIRSMLLRNYREGLRTSAYGWIDDAIALCTPWGFDPADITDLTIEYENHAPWRVRELVIGERAGKRPPLPEHLGEVPAEASRLLAAAEDRSAVRKEQQAPAVAYRLVSREAGHV